jgi:hypothetical protein
MLKITSPRLLDILNPKIDRVATVYESDHVLSPVVYWQTRPYDERIAAVISTVGVLTDMRLTLDMLEFVGYLNDHQVGYLVVGGYALGFHGHPRFTKDLDIWIERTPENAQKLAQAMLAFGVRLSPKEIEAFVSGGPIRIGRPPNLIDVIGHPDGVTFAECYAVRETTSFEGLKIDFISRSDFIRNKRASGRLQDLADVENIEKLGGKDQ